MDPKVQELLVGEQIDPHEAKKSVKKITNIVLNISIK